MTNERMVQMANQIALFFGARPHEEAVDAVAEHLRSFWEKRMREQLVEYITGGAAGLNKLVIEAVRRI